MTVQEWEEYFSGKTLPAEIKLDDATVIKNPRQCIDSHLAVLKNSGNNSTFSGFGFRFEAIRKYLDQQV